MMLPVVRLAVSATVLTLGEVVLLIAASLRVTWLMFPGFALYFLQALIFLADKPRGDRFQSARCFLLPLFFYLICSVLFPLWMVLDGRNLFAPSPQSAPAGVIVVFALMWPLGIGLSVWDYFRKRGPGLRSNDSTR